jgi:hypothetical protein
MMSDSLYDPISQKLTELGYDWVDPEIIADYLSVGENSGWFFYVDDFGKFDGMVRRALKNYLATNPDPPLQRSRWFEPDDWDPTE